MIQGRVKRVYFFLERIHGSWCVDCAGRLLGPCPSREQAIADAIKVVAVYGDASAAVSIVGPDEHGNVRALWRQPALA
jgi:hypothetical protein